MQEYIPNQETYLGNELETHVRVDVAPSVSISFFWYSFLAANTSYFMFSVRDFNENVHTMFAVVSAGAWSFEIQSCTWKLSSESHYTRLQLTLRFSLKWRKLVQLHELYQFHWVELTHIHFPHISIVFYNCRKSNGHRWCEWSMASETSPKFNLQKYGLAVLRITAKLSVKGNLHIDL